MKINYKALLQFTLPLIIFSSMFFLIGYFKSYHLPKIKSWLLLELEETTRKNLPVRIWPQTVELSLFPLSATFTKVRIIPNANLKPMLAPTTIQTVTGEVSLLHLLTGKLKISKLSLIGADLTLVLPETQKPETSPPVAQQKININSEFIDQLPIVNIEFRNINLTAKYSSQNMAVKAENIFFGVTIDGPSFFLEFETPNLHVKKVGDEPILTISLGTKLVLNENFATLTALKIKKKNSYFVGTGNLKGDPFNGRWSQFDFRFRNHIELAEMAKITKEFLPNSDLPEISGQLASEIDLEMKNGGKPNISFLLNTKNLFLEGFEIGAIKSQGNIEKDTVKIDKGSVRNSAGVVNISDSDFSLGESKNFSANLDVKKLELGRLLKALKVGDVPISLPLSGDVPCYGSFAPKFLIKCKGTAKVESLNVWSGEKKPFTIVELGEARVIGEVLIDLKHVEYDTQLKIGKSYGWSKGSISYDKGFDIKYGGQVNSLKGNLKNLANLKLEGSTTIKGRTNGNSSYGRIDMDVKGKALWLEDFGLGNANFNIQYRKGILTFRNIQAHKNATRYNGHTSVNLLNSTIYTSIKVPFLDVADVQHLLERRASLPISLGGTGSAQIELRGPLQINKLSYDFSTSIYRGTIGNETFDQINFDVASKDGHVESKNIQASKADSRITLKGQVNPDGLLDAVILGEKLRLEQSETLSELGLNVGGRFDFTMAMKGPILSPNTELHGRLSRMIIGERPEEDSQFWLRFNEDSLEGKGHFIGNVVETDFKIPYKNNGPFRLYAKTKDWNFTHLFNMFSGAVDQQFYQTRLTSEFNLESSHSGFWGASGKVTIDDFYLKRGDSYLQNNGPMNFIFEKGVINSDNFHLEGPSSFLDLSLKNSNRNDVNTSINGKFDLGLLTLITPFLDDLRGTASLSLNIKGPADQPEILGSAYVQNGFIALKGLIHPFEKMTSDILFNQRNIVINALKANFAGGILTADGSIWLKSPDNIPINIKGYVDKVSLHIPEGFNTRGSGNLFFKGTKLPYVLGGSFKVEDGKIDANLTKSSGQSQKIKPSDFLPKFLSKEALDPIHLDFKVDLVNPIPVYAVVPESQIATSIDGNMSIKGSPNSPLLTGIIRSRPNGQMTFRSNSFNITSAVIEYDNQPPQEPNLFVTAKTNIKAKTSAQSNDNEEARDDYEVTLDVQGNAKDPTINLTSQPQLAEADIVSLLAFGVTSSSYQKYDSDQQVIQSGMEVGAQIVKQQLGLDKAVEKTTGLKFDLSSTMDDENTAAPKISIRKQFTPNFGMSYSRTEGKSPADEMKLEYKFNPKLSVVGLMERQEPGTATDSDLQNKNQEKIGVDLEYKFQFK